MKLSMTPWMPAALAAMLAAMQAPAFGHHSYGAYDRTRTVSVEGVIERIAYANPHVTMVLKTAGDRRYTVEWGTVNQLNRAGVNSATLHVGDDVAITGFALRDPAKLTVSLLTEVRRVKDGWRWTRRVPLPASGTGDAF